MILKHHAWFRGGKWHYSIPTVIGGTTIVWWPRGSGDSAPAAYADYEKRAKEWK